MVVDLLSNDNRVWCNQKIIFYLIDFIDELPIEKIN